MVSRLQIPNYAKRAARKALRIRSKLPKYKKHGMSPSEAKSIGVISGVNQARYLIKNRSMSAKKAKEYYLFYQRFKNCRTRKCRNAIDLWGGRKFLKFQVTNFIKKKNA